MKKFYLLLILCYSVLAASAQTMVSGGIYTNTTWTKANSPYIVTDTVVVFPDIILTIEPGVTVKFDPDQLIEFRSSTLNANGKNDDSITFTSNAAEPSNLDHGGLLFDGGTYQPEFSYCNFYFGQYAVRVKNVYSTYRFKIRNSLIKLNNWGIATGLSTVLLDSCLFTGNKVGLQGQVSGSFNTFYKNENGANLIGPGILENSVFEENSTGLSVFRQSVVNRCSLLHNQTGVLMGAMNSKLNNCWILFNTIGIELSGAIESEVNSCVVDSNMEIGILIGAQSKNNVIRDNHIEYNGVGIKDSICYQNLVVKNYIQFNQVGIDLYSERDSFTCNLICGNTNFTIRNFQPQNISFTGNNWCSDSIQLTAKILDGYDDVHYGLILFMPMDSSCAPVLPASVQEWATADFSIAPNPFSHHATLKSVDGFNNGAYALYNMQGQCVSRRENLNGHTIQIEKGSLDTGIYFLLVTESGKVYKQKLVIE